MPMKRLVIILISILVAGSVIGVGIWYLRTRDVGTPETSVRSTTGTSAAARATRTPSDYTEQELKQLEEVKRLQNTLPGDIRETWSSEFRSQQEQAPKKVAPISP